MRSAWNGHGAERVQRASAGSSNASIVKAVLAAAAPKPGLSWLDIGCGTGALLREVRDHFDPDELTGVDLIDWLPDDLRGDVRHLVAPGEQGLTRLEPADRVLMVETIEHLEAPWFVLREAAALVRPGGRLVVSTPNLATLRHRLELLVCGRLTSFRPGNLPHLSPALPHVTERVLREHGFAVQRGYAGPDVLPLTGGRPWPEVARSRLAVLGSISVIVAGCRPAAAGSAGPT